MQDPVARALSAYNMDRGRFCGTNKTVSFFLPATVCPDTAFADTVEAATGTEARGDRCAFDGLVRPPCRHRMHASDSRGGSTHSGQGADGSRHASVLSALEVEAALESQCMHARESCMRILSKSVHPAHWIRRTMPPPELWVCTRDAILRSWDLFLSSF